jgi:hypothetical protein
MVRRQYLILLVGTTTKFMAYSMTKRTSEGKTLILNIGVVGISG